MPHLTANLRVCVTHETEFPSETEITNAEGEALLALTAKWLNRQTLRGVKKPETLRARLREAVAAGRQTRAQKRLEQRRSVERSQTYDALAAQAQRDRDRLRRKAKAATEELAAHIDDTVRHGYRTHAPQEIGETIEEARAKQRELETGLSNLTGLLLAYEPDFAEALRNLNRRYCTPTRDDVHTTAECSAFFEVPAGATEGLPVHEIGRADAEKLKPCSRCA